MKKSNLNQDQDELSNRPSMSEKDKLFDYRLEHDPRFLQRIERARNGLRAGKGVRLEDIET